MQGLHVTQDLIRPPHLDPHGQLAGQQVLQAALIQLLYHPHRGRKPRPLQPAHGCRGAGEARGRGRPGWGWARCFCRWVEWGAVTGGRQHHGMQGCTVPRCPPQLSRSCTISSCQPTCSQAGLSAARAGRAGPRHRPGIVSRRRRTDGEHHNVSQDDSLLHPVVGAQRHRRCNHMLQQPGHAPQQRGKGLQHHGCRNGWGSCAAVQ